MSGMNGLVIVGIGETWYLYCRTSGEKRFGRVGRNMSFNSKAEAEMVMQRYRETYPNQEFEVREYTAPIHTSRDQSRRVK